MLQLVKVGVWSCHVLRVANVWIFFWSWFFFFFFNVSGWCEVNQGSPRRTRGRESLPLRPLPERILLRSGLGDADFLPPWPNLRLAIARDHRWVLLHGKVRTFSHFVQSFSDIRKIFSQNNSLFRLEVPENFVKGAYVVAARLRMDEIRTECAKFMLEHLSPDNCLGIRSIQGIKHDPEFAEAIDNYIRREVSKIHSLPRLTVSVSLNFRLFISVTLFYAGRDRRFSCLSTFRARKKPAFEIVFVFFFFCPLYRRGTAGCVRFPRWSSSNWVTSSSVPIPAVFFFFVYVQTRLTRQVTPETLCMLLVLKPNGTFMWPSYCSSFH